MKKFIAFFILFMVPCLADIQSDLNSLSAGDVYILEGTTTLSNVLVVPAGVTLSGNSHCTGATSNDCMTNISGAGIALMDGASVMNLSISDSQLGIRIVEGSGSSIQNVRIFGARKGIVSYGASNIFISDVFVYNVEESGSGVTLVNAGGHSTLDKVFVVFDATGTFLDGDGITLASCYHVTLSDILVDGAGTGVSVSNADVTATNVSVYFSVYGILIMDAVRFTLSSGIIDAIHYGVYVDGPTSTVFLSSVAAEGIAGCDTIIKRVKKANFGSCVRTGLPRNIQSR